MRHVGAEMEKENGKPVREKSEKEKQDKILNYFYGNSVPSVIQFVSTPTGNIHICYFI